jgi:hypothetical protein
MEIVYHMVFTCSHMANNAVAPQGHTPGESLFLNKPWHWSRGACPCISTATSSSTWCNAGIGRIREISRSLIYLDSARKHGPTDNVQFGFGPDGKSLLYPLAVILLRNPRAGTT